VRPLTAVDFFSGAGGLTEGFRQQGFEVLYALDTWKLALESHLLNHPETAVSSEDILQVNVAEIPRSDLVIGSPPCTQFSYANRGGGGDIDLGMRLVLRFLRIVHELRPRYWVMENVPRLLDSLPDRVSLRRLGLKEEGFLEIPRRDVLNAADFGVPQARLRLFSGKFPSPSPTHARADTLESHLGRAPWVPARTVVNALPDPLSVPSSERLVRDPNFPSLEVAETKVTDHYMDTRLTREEVESCRRSKTDHSWYGRMSFPDRLDRPARTVMATQSGVSRETFVIAVKGPNGTGYRRPTVRECATFQAFPLTYQFAGGSSEARLKQIGNAVPPPLAGAVARAIWKRSGRSALKLPVVKGAPALALPPSTPPRHARATPVYAAGRRFRDHLPGSRAGGVRVDFDNLAGHKVGSGQSRTRRTVRWSGRLYCGSGETVRSATSSVAQALALLDEELESSEDRAALIRLLSELTSSLETLRPTRNGLQRAWAGRGLPEDVSPASLIVELARIVERVFPAEEWGDRALRLPPEFPRVGRETLPVRAAAFLLAASMAAAAANDSVGDRHSAIPNPETVRRETRTPSRSISVEVDLLIRAIRNRDSALPRKVAARTLTAYAES
jgi:DNA (cytosine-5)-methyltransferase 1